MSQSEKDGFYGEASKHFNEYKRDIFYSSKRAEHLMPLLHVLMYLLINYLYIDKHNKLEELASRLEEYRMLPLPYGLLANELIQVID